MNKFDKMKAIKAREIHVWWCQTAFASSDGVVSLVMYEVIGNLINPFGSQIRNQVVYPITDHIIWTIRKQAE
jgi:hypothetical protein